MTPTDVAVSDWIRPRRPGRYVARQLLRIWPFVPDPKVFGKEFKKLVEAGRVPRVRLVGKRSASLLYELSAE